MYPFLAVGFIMGVVMVLFVVCALALILLVLIQKGKGGGLSGALGGGLASGILGSKTGDFLTWLTVGLAGVFLFFAILMAKFYRPEIRDIGVEQPPMMPGQQMPTTPPPPVEQIPQADVNVLLPDAETAPAPETSVPAESVPGPEGSAPVTEPAVGEQGTTPAVEPNAAP
jgi:preprotein translocase subunit SecG